MLSIIDLNLPHRTKRPPNWTGRVVPITNRPEFELRNIVAALNGNLTPGLVIGEETARAEERRQKEIPPQLRQIVQLWKSSGPDLAKFSFAHLKLSREVNECFAKMPKLLVCAPAGGAAIGFGGPGPVPAPREEALRLFIELIMNPQHGRLAGPCDRCGKYYIRRSANNKRYCSRSCGTRATALAATKKKREEEHAEKLRRAAAAAQKWKRAARTKFDWKQWVHRSEPDITPKFLTRAINQGELETPVRQ